MVKETNPKVTTWMCDNGHHGTTERRHTGDTPDTRFKDMWQGSCAGTVYSIMTMTETDCGCECHNQYDFKEHLRAFYPEEYKRRFG